MKPLGTQLIAEFINCSQGILNDKTALERTLKNGIKESGLTLKSITGHKFDPVGVTVIAVISESHIGIHTYPEARHASVDIFTCAAGSGSVEKLLQFLKSKMKPKSVRFVELDRGNPLTVRQKKWITSFSGAGFEIKYHIVKKLLSKRSDYQQIDVIENDSFGNMLFLDKDLQIAESDAHLYNDSMAGPIMKARKKPKEVAILGGGDGGVLNEVLTYAPDRVHLIEIDREVIRASEKYLKGVCNGAFRDPRATIVIDDVNRYLEDKHQFDAIIYDLTMYPESLTRMERTQFLNEIFSKVRNSLKSGGSVSMQCCSEYDRETRKLLRNILPRYFENIQYRSVFIPSFCETWVFASARAK